ncbi:DUF547 domain-containing protein [Brumicola nitratireducens]|uniref:DUF547 domain-containing protein n=1 Tax=Glaciecola nitratireducens (strain JCM 12485 / KCTC 12276 / FR1064) TaxID=1085623 RepID=G4QEY4_GLANF|nr:hypothetical protein GNIT_0093 [Glaciecola nitratireducens FR1064]
MHKLTSSLANTSVMKGYAIASIIVLAMFTSVIQAKPLHENWNTLLTQHVSPVDKGHSTSVDYKGFLAQRSQLKNYLKELEQISQSDFDKWSDNKKLAFLINAYNAWTVELILTEYPDLKSIRDLGSFFRSPWEKSFIPLLGNTYSLDDIEHELIRGDNKYQEPRIHFAVNCASIGCPALREEAYEESKLEMQLEEQTQRFLSDKSRNYIQGKQLYLSSIFKWYKGDFEKGFRGANSLESFLLLYPESLKLSENERTTLKNNDMEIDFLDYDWQLNDVKK